MEDLTRAFAVLDSDPDEAHALASEVLNDDPNNGAALHICAVIQCRAGRYGMAIGLWERLSRIRPNKPEVWNNLGQTYGNAGLYDESKRAYRRSLELRETADVTANMAVCFNEAGDYKEGAKWARKALELEPGHRNATATLGFSKLAHGDWSGWKEYAYSIGSKFRTARDYAPVWDGKPVDSLVIYGEQGLGDEIVFASCVHDAQKVAKHVTIECDHRLEGLFRRSFPDCDVFGTRLITTKEWTRKLDAQVACGGLPEHFRPTKDACPKTPYLVADPERRLQWRALFKSYGKPVIGICWSGGNKFTKRALRRVGLESFRPLIETTDAIFVSLQHQDAAEEINATGLPVKQFHWATLTDDYDDTAALVAELDMVVGIHTTVHHVAGAMGVPSVILVPHNPTWMYVTGDSLAWYASQKFHRQRKDEAWVDCIRRVKLDTRVRGL